jgi:Leucine-rich repeat (LRR) protein
MTGVVANAANYGINVAGVEVNNNNCSYITGNDIKSGYGVYDENSNTLTLYNIKIVRTTSGDYALHNRSCDNLTVKFVGTCNLSSTAARAIRFDAGGSLVATSGSMVNVTGSNDGAIYVRNENTLTVKGPGTFIIKSTSKKGAIQANLSGSTSSGSPMETVEFRSDANAVIESPESPLYDIYYVDFHAGCNVILKATNNSSYPVVRNVKNMSFYSNSNGKPAILAPYGAYFSPSAKSIVTSSGNTIYSQDIYISSHYVAIINSDNFPDANFRSALLSLYPNGYITSSDVDSSTSLDVSNKAISNLTGIEIFSKLTYLNCSGNNISQLNVQTLTALKNLNASSNQLTSMTLPSSIETLNLSNNKKFTTFSMVNKSALKSLDLSNCSGVKTVSVYNNTAMTSLNVYNCTALTTLNCYNCALNSLNVANCSAMTSLDCHSNQLTSLGTLPTSLQTIDCSSNKLSGTFSVTGRSALKSLKVSDNPSITRLDCYNNSLTTLGVSGCSAITYLDCHGNQLIALGVPSSVQTLNCANNKFSGYFTLNYYSALKSLDVSSNPSITGLWCNNNALTSLNISGCTAITTLICSNNQLTALNYLPMTLQTLDCSSNKFSDAFQITGRSSLKSLNISSNPNLTSLTCCHNGLTSLNVGGCSALTTIDCTYCQLTSLDISTLSNLTELLCYDNKLTSLNASNRTKLTYLRAYRNQLTSINVQGCTALKVIECDDNKITSLSFQGCNSLTFVNCWGNQIKESAMTSLINSLRTIPAGSQGKLEVIYPGQSNEGNVITSAQVMTARNKRWYPKKYDGSSWVDIFDSSAVPGDVNGDGFVTSGDVTALYSYMLNNDSSQIVNGDVDGDGHITSGDITALYTILLGQ